MNRRANCELRPSAIIFQGVRWFAVAVVLCSIVTAGPAADGSDLAVDLSDADDSGLTNTIKIDFTPYADISKLGDGEAKSRAPHFGNGRDNQADYALTAAAKGLSSAPGW